MATPSVDPAVQQLLRQHEFLELVESGEGDNKRVRVKCQLTQHEMLPRADVIAQHVDSKKFVKARDWYCHDYSQYEPYIVPHRRLTKSLFCNVTGTILNRIPYEVERHIQGKRYKRMKQHVKVTVTKTEGDDELQGNADFDADAFEFENSQVVYSDDEQEEAQGGEEQELEEGAAKPKKDDGEDDMADLYPDDESDEEETKDADGDEAMEEKPKKKRPATGNTVTKKTRHHTKRAKKTD
ncbi:Surfeit locus protein 2 [Phytophthora pseudosyringae]|uniref:Surfeit locus protein 2 n=1 Tax=Phytophthora pseudosyringae TaxID=221518 RepID=A0A8T1VUP2_9STRA|nr:Surfeit locus protein 2 [Phytophthora pseudosyringae]